MKDSAITGKRKKYRLWNSRERQLILDHYGPLSRDPWPVARIASAIGQGVTIEEVRYAAKRYRMCYRLRRGRENPRPRDRDIMYWYRKGYSDSQIAMALNWDRNQVQRWRKRRGIPAIRGPGGCLLARG